MKSGQTSTRRRQALPGIPGIYVLLFCDLVRQLGYDDRRLLEGLELQRSQLLAPDARVSVADAAQVLHRGLAIAGHEGLGFRYASALKVTLHGSLGLLALSSMTIRDALEAGTHYLGLRAPFLDFVWQTGPDAHDQSRIKLEVRERFPLGRQHDFIMEAMLMGLVYMVQQLNEDALDDAEVWLTGPPPPHYATLAESLPVPVRYNAPFCMVQASAVLLDQRPRLADPSIAALAREQCEAEFQKLFAAPESLLLDVRQRLVEYEEGTLSLEQMADRLHMSSRTLKRRLQDEGANYREIVEAVLRERATRLLMETDLPVSEIAFRTGYNDVSNFTRAFKRWTGKTPRDFRR
ncbi:MAG: AraC family transcriptional regulator ligand-binding domain-containing protein [Moraxellaceae bacterium]